MIKLDAIVATDRFGTNVSWDSVPGWALRYECFLGDLRFSIGEADFSTQWGWVPVLDFALAINSLLDALESGSSRVFEFTESEAFIRLTRINDVIEVTSSYSSGAGRADIEELRAVARDFARRLGERLREKHPDLRQNSDFLGALRRAGVS